MPSFRYLLHFSYIGTRYSGVAEQFNQPLVKTVYSELIKSIEALKTKPVLNSQLYISSRTDAGVHALHNTAHIDLDFDNANKGYTFPFDKAADQRFCDQIKHDLNKTLHENEETIKILNIQKVKPMFTARGRAKARTYVFRLALLKDEPKLREELIEKPKSNEKNKRFKKTRLLEELSRTNFLTPFEEEFTTPICSPFDFELFKKAVEICTGQHNFSAFTTNLGREDIIKSKRLPVKTLKIDLNFIENGSFLQEFTPVNQRQYSILEVEITAESFLYKMIRKLVGGMVTVAKNRLPLSTFQNMLEVPPDYYDNDQNIQVLGGDGLILKKVHYDEKDFEYSEKDYELYLREKINKIKNT